MIRMEATASRGTTTTTAKPYVGSGGDTMLPGLFGRVGAMDPVDAGGVV